MVKKLIFKLLFLYMFCISFCMFFTFTSHAKENIVVVIDPGHGGENLGTDYLPVPEKYYNMQVALFMKQQLETYKNVEVYLTHTEDVDMSLKDRAVFAQNVGADFLFSLHFNMSLSHSLYGSEIWIPSTGSLYSQGYSAGNEFLLQFQEMGLFSRGIKTRIGNSGTDYYGIIRQCALRNIPAIIVEHCHVDNANDIEFIQSPDKLKEFGIRNAEAVAKYFGLKSKDGNMDYSDYAPLAVPVPEVRMYNDTTAPLFLYAQQQTANKTGKYMTFTLTGVDAESPLQYYAYSFDNGATWSKYYPWNKGQNAMNVIVSLGYSKLNSIIFKVTNLYDIETISNTIKLNNTGLK